jgi:tetratricopeptide (TPR) repeat protein
MDTCQVIARFEAERQALAMMDHPNIARVLDAGATDTGRPYFVMDLVKGIPITDYCDQNHLSIRQRLGLFTQVCHAVQHAHQKGIIHRDLKPSNVLVAEYDDKPVPKVIDFGVAKATAQRLTERTLFTQYGQIVGTFEYMSPEQARFNQLDVDTRSDIYSLGIMLYELLAGSTPLEKERLRSAAFEEILRLIGVEEPPKPSTRLSSSQSLPSIAANRHTEPARLSREVRGELDWIVMRSLEKDRQRRYQTADALSGDIDRHLAGQPVEAGPPSRTYRFRKFARQHKTALAITAAAAVAALTAVGGIGWELRDRSARVARLNDGLGNALNEASRARDEALARIDNPSDWQSGLAAALSALKGAEELAAQDEMAIDSAKATQMQELRKVLNSDETDHRFVARLDEILSAVCVWDAHRNRTKHQETFDQIEKLLGASYGWSVGATPVNEIVRSVQQRPKEIQGYLLLAFDVALARAPKDQKQTRQWFADVIASLDSDPWRQQARESLAAGNWPVLDRLLQNVDVSQHQPSLLLMLSSFLPEQYLDTKGLLQRKIHKAFPGELWAFGRFNTALTHNLLAWTMVLNHSNAAWGLDLAQTAVRLVPDDGDFCSVLGIAYYRAGRWQEAILELEKAMELAGGGDSEEWYFLAMAYWQLGNKGEARRWYAKAAEWQDKNDPDNYEFRTFRTEAAILLNVDDYPLRVSSMIHEAAQEFDRVGAELHEAVTWMDKNHPDDPLLRQLRADAVRILNISQPAPTSDGKEQP